MVSTRSQRKKSCLVIGGAGFLGRHLVDALSSDFRVTIFDVRESGDPYSDFIAGDLREISQVFNAFEKSGTVDVVFHTATAAPSSDNAANRALMREVNIGGTQNVILACVRYKVPKLVFTSTASVVYDGQDLNNVDETAPYAQNPLDYYTSTKMEAEKMVLAANGREGLATVVLRPSGIFGEWDRLTVPTLVENAKRGRSKFIIGSGRNLMEFTYVGNVADAHVLAAEKLSLDSPVAGQAYFVTNNEPVPFWGFIGDVLEPLGYPRPRIRLPWLPLLLLALLLERIIQPLLKPIVTLKPSDFSSSRIRLVSSNRVISCEKAKRDLGYVPKVEVQEGLKRTVAHFRHLSNVLSNKEN